MASVTVIQTYRRPCSIFGRILIKGDSEHIRTANLFLSTVLHGHQPFMKSTILFSLRAIEVNVLDAARSCAGNADRKTLAHGELLDGQDSLLLTSEWSDWEGIFHNSIMEGKLKVQQ